jgi:hypothetical protein
MQTKSVRFRVSWLVTLHQGLSIPVADRIESEHCSGWAASSACVSKGACKSAAAGAAFVRCYEQRSPRNRAFALAMVPGIGGNSDWSRLFVLSMQGHLPRWTKAVIFRK